MKIKTYMCIILPVVYVGVKLGLSPHEETYVVY